MYLELGVKMSPEFAEDLCKYLEQLKEDNAPKECYPRFYYHGHILHDTQAVEEKIWKAESGRIYPFCKEICTWECRECKHEFKGDDGTVCPSCGAISNK
jgi:rubrerythrin